MWRGAGCRVFGRDALSHWNTDLWKQVYIHHVNYMYGRYVLWISCYLRSQELTGCHSTCSSLSISGNRFSPNDPQGTTHSSSWRTSYGMSFVVSVVLWIFCEFRARATLYIVQDWTIIYNTIVCKSLIIPLLSLLFSLLGVSGRSESSFLAREKSGVTSRLGDRCGSLSYPDSKVHENNVINVSVFVWRAVAPFTNMV